MKKISCWIASAALAVTLGGCGTASNPVAPSSVLDSSPPQAPVGMTQAVNASNVRILTWNQNSESDLGSYQIYQYSPDPTRENAYVLVATLNAASNEWPLPTNMGVVITWVRLRALDQSGNRSAESAPIQVAYLPTSAGSELPADNPPPIRR